MGRVAGDVPVPERADAVKTGSVRPAENGGWLAVITELGFPDLAEIAFNESGEGEFDLSTSSARVEETLFLTYGEALAYVESQVIGGIS